MPKPVYTAEEDAWFDVIRSCVPNTRDNTVKGDWLLAVHRRFVERHPWRNARLVEHIPCSATHVGLVLWGDNWGRMYEHVRHKLNNKPSASKATRPEGARVELQDSLATIEARHRGEGFLEIESGSPYAIDHRALELQQIASVRTLLYERGGFGGICDVQRERNRLDIPRDIDDFAEVLHANTGAQIYILAAWPTGNGETEYYEMATLDSDLVLEPENQSKWSMERGRQRFLELQNYRNEWPHWNVAIIISYLHALWEWQGGTLPIPWEEEDSPIDDTLRIVQAYRLSNGMLRFTHPESWSLDCLTGFVKHVHDGQRRLLPNGNTFQFCVLGNDLVDSELRVTRHPNSQLTASGPTRMFVARLLRSHETDIIVQNELIFQFPCVTDDSGTSAPWNLDELNELRDHCLGNAQVMRLAKEYVAYEKLQPPFASRARWAIYRRVCPQMDVECPVSSFFIEVLHGWWLPEAFYSHPNQTAYLEELSELISGDLWMDRLTGVHFAGYYGICWAVLLLIRLFWNISMLEDAEAPDRPRYLRGKSVPADALQNVLADIDWLAAEIRLSNERVQTIRAAGEEREYECQSYSEHTFTRVGWAKAPSILSDSEELSPLSPPRRVGILKNQLRGSKKKAGQWLRMQAVIPKYGKSKQSASSRKQQENEETKSSGKGKTVQAGKRKATSKRERTATSGSSSRASNSGSPRKLRERK